jgi:hypothetical protein
MIKCYFDEHGCRRADPNGLHPLIASYLEQDVQGCIPTCLKLVGILDEFKAGRRDERSGTGNAHTVTIRPDVVVIENDWAEDFGEARLSHDVFRACLEDWMQFISSRAKRTK